MTAKRIVNLPPESDRRILAIFGLHPDPDSPEDYTIYRRGLRNGAILYGPAFPRPWGVCWTNGLDEGETCWTASLDTALRVLVRMT